MTYRDEVSGHNRSVIILVVILMALFTGGIAKASQAGASILASQPSAACSLFPSTTPKDPDNSINCRSTNPKLSIYLENIGDTSACTFNYTFDWGDGTPPENIYDFPGGPAGLEFTTSYTYSDPGVYTIQLASSVASGDCAATGGVFQFSYIMSTTPYPQGPPINALEMISRGADWVAAQVPYDQGSYHSDIDGVYRQDCSGFVSMMWDLDYSLDTTELASVSTAVTAGFSGLQPGDILLSPGHHVVLFAEWANSTHTSVTIMSEPGKNQTPPYAREITVPLSYFSSGKHGVYTAYSYDNEVAAGPNETSGKDSAGAPVALTGGNITGKMGENRLPLFHDGGEQLVTQAALRQSGTGVTG